MAADINRAPVGLLGFLDIKNQGKNPSPLSEAMAATFPLTDWYLQTAAEYLSEGALEIAGPALGYYQWNQGGTNLRVPDNQWWLVHEYSALTLLTAGGGSAGATDVVLNLTYEVPMPVFTGGGATGNAIDLPTSPWVPGLAAVTPKPSFSLLKPIWVPPGAVFGYQLTYIPAGGQVRTAFSIRFTRLRI